MPNCLKCGTPLKAIGTSRKNGKLHRDWDTREYHKKCYKDITFSYIFNEFQNS